MHELIKAWHFPHNIYIRCSFYSDVEPPVLGWPLEVFNVLLVNAYCENFKYYFLPFYRYFVAFIGQLNKSSISNICVFRWYWLWLTMKVKSENCRSVCVLFGFAVSNVNFTHVTMEDPRCNSSGDMSLVTYAIGGYVFGSVGFFCLGLSVTRITYKVKNGFA